MAEQFGIRSNPNKDIRLPKAVAVKNKQPSDRQITAEQLLREAHTIQIETEFAPPKQTIADPEELEEHRSVMKQLEDPRMKWRLIAAEIPTFAPSPLLFFLTPRLL